MPCRFRYLTPRRLLIQHFAGTPDLPAVLAHYDRVLAHPALPDTRFELTDMRTMTGLGVDARALAGLVALLSSEYLRRIQTFQRGAVITGSGPGEFAARLFLDALPARVQPRYAIFRDTAAAMAWLDLGDAGAGSGCAVRRNDRARATGAP